MSRFYGGSRNALQENGSYAGSGMDWILFWYGNLYGNHKIREAKGSSFHVTALAPQGIFYAMAGIVLFRYMLEYPMVRWDGKSIRFGLFLMLGIITECYVNPVLTGLFLKTL